MTSTSKNKRTRHKVTLKNRPCSKSLLQDSGLKNVKLASIYLRKTEVARGVIWVKEGDMPNPILGFEALPALDKLNRSELRDVLYVLKQEVKRRRAEAKKAGDVLVAYVEDEPEHHTREHLIKWVGLFGYDTEYGRSEECTWFKCSEDIV